MLARDGRLPRVIAVLLAATAALFVVAVSAERAPSGHVEAPAAAASSPAETATHAPEGEANEAREHTEVASESVSHSKEGTLLGIRLESPVLVALGALLSVAFAAALWLRPSVTLLTAAGVFSTGFAVLDVFEASRLRGESNSVITVAAVVLVIGHAAAAALALGLVAKRRRIPGVAT